MRTIGTGRRPGAAAALALGLVVAALGACAPPADPPGTVTRPSDPVVVTGSQVAPLLGVPAGDVVAFRYLGGSGWGQIPVQVDQRKVVELNTVYHQPANTTRPVNVSVYADAGTWTGPGSGIVEAADEIAFLATDAGGAAPSFSEPAGVVADSGVKLTATDGRAGGAQSFVYLFRQAGGLDPAAGQDYVDYQFRLTSGPYRSAYKLTDGPNPETSSVTTASYSRSFSDRWTDDGLTITAGSASAVDILDRHKALFAPGVCGRSENTFNDAEGAFVANIDGPVRAIRSYIGANSGPYTQRTHIFSPQREDIVTDLRVHQISSVMDFFDYSPAAAGMTYTNDRNLAGVTIDGRPDTVASGGPTWEKVDGSQGALTHVWAVHTDAAPVPTVTNYYHDQSRVPNPVTQCTGDAFSYGASGTYVNSAIPNTDPHAGSANTFSVAHTLFYEAPGRSNEAAQAHADQTLQPLALSATPWTR